MAGFGGFGAGFGATQSASPFGQTTPAFSSTPLAFGQTQAVSAPFGATPSTGMFGSTTPAFGSSTSTFGAASAPAFSAGAFGAKPATGTGFGGFGTSTTPNPFTISQPTFGAAAAPGGFGSAQPATPSFGGFGGTPATPAFGSGFGASSSPAFGAAASTPAFGMAGGSGFGATTPTAFGSGGFGTPGAFGGAAPAPAPGSGSRAVQYQKTHDNDSQQSAGGQKQLVYFTSISAMPAYLSKSVEELRAEDYAAGVKGNTGQPAVGGFGTPGLGGFGQPAASSSPFGTPASTPAFGSFGSATPATPAFGSSTFGAASAPAFGAAASTPAFGSLGASTPAFGAPASTPAFGSFGTASAPAFSTPGSSAFGSTFGAPASTPAFSFSSSTPAFGAAASAPAFGAAATGSSPFGFGGGSTGGTLGFGAPSSAAFSFASSMSAFGAASAPSLFGGSAASPGFGASPGGFGSGLFGQTKPAGGSMFGSTQSGLGQPAAPAFSFANTGGNMFGQASAPAFGAGAFGAGSAASPGGFSFALGGQQAQQAQQLMAPVQAPGVATSPYGALPAAPQVAGVQLPEHRVGITARPPSSGGGYARPSAMVAPRSITPRSGVRLRSGRSRGVPRVAAQQSPSDFLSDRGSEDAEGSGGLFVTHNNPRQFFVPGGDGGKAHGGGSGSGGGGDGQEQDGEPAENGAAGGGRSRDERADGPISDEEVGRLLPRLTRDDYFLEPSLPQLAAMAREDPASLAAVANFAVGARDMGRVRWLEPVDVRALNLDAVVRMGKGSVEVYLKEEDRPPVGEGLNRAAEVTLMNVFRIDSATHRPTTDPEAIERYKRKLKKVVADQGARFIGYDAKEGVWRFEVEHFSRYGLLDSDDEEPPKKGPGKYAPGRGDAGGDQREGEGDEAMERSSDDGGGGAAADEAAAAMAAAAAVAEAGFDGEGEGAAGGGAAVAAEAPTPAVPERAQCAWQRVAPALQPPGLDAHQPTARASDAASDAASAPQPLDVAIGTVGAERSVVDAGTLLGRSFRAGWGPGGVLAVPAPAAPGKRASGAIPRPPRLELRRLDIAAGLAARGAGETLAGGPSKASADPGAGARARERLQELLELLLRHSAPEGSQGLGTLEECPTDGQAAEDGQGGGGEAEQAPLWGLRCAREGELHELACAVMRVNQKYLQGPEAPVLRHECWTWELLHVLFSHIPGEPRAPRSAPLRSRNVGAADDMQTADGESPADDRLNRGVERREGEPREGEFDDGVDANGSAKGGAAQLAAFRRREGLSRWLQDRARPEVEAALAGEGDAAARDRARPEVEAALAVEGDAAARVAHLLAGHQLAAAAALASASGDVRLAGLVCQAAASSGARADVRAQLRVWESAGMSARVAGPRLLAWRLLGGEVDAVVRPLQLDWRRALGAHLWYRHAPSAPPAAALETFARAAAVGDAPPPAPRYHERLRTRSAGPARPPPAVDDVNYGLLRVFAGVDDPADPAALARLLAPAAVTPARLDHWLGWALLEVLRAIGVAPLLPTGSSTKVFALHASMVAQLEALGLPQWAVFVALHLPDELPSEAGLGSPAGAGGFCGARRTQLVRELLRRHAPAWADARGAAAFLVGRLRLPREWLADALAGWAVHRRDVSGELAQRLAARQWAAAHALLAWRQAPRWLRSGRIPPLRAALEALQPHVPARAWRAGGGLFATYLQLKAVYAAVEAGDLAAAPRAARSHACEALAVCLRAAEAAAPPAETTAADLALLQAVRAEAARALAGWLLADAAEAASPAVAESEARVLALPALPPDARSHHLQAAVAALGAVLG
ncbi:hypothetical protein WJX81_006497 [Elliptochloris bilobata]|uniref:Peptidase S59 domain-containing protein n=1 Tax=Elliptochloris bilobata TaxID=381761 RepID=A0AAW1SI42_9CHLO